MFQGSIVALVTPMQNDGSLDLDSWCRLLEWHLAAGTDGVVVAGTTGESATLKPAEFEQLLTTAVEILKGKITVLAGTGTNATASTIERTQRAAALGADGTLIVTPYYNRPSQHGLMAHYESVAEQTDIPIVLYNVPSRTGVDLHPETTAHLSQVPSIVAIKEANATPARLPELLTLLEQDFSILSGDDPTCASSIAAGAQGVISVVANAAPATVARMALSARTFCNSTKTANPAKKLASATDNDDNKDRMAPEHIMLDQRLQPLYELASLGGNPTGIKWCLWQSQRIQRGIRLPLTWLHPDQEGQAQALYQQVADLVT